MNSRQQHLSPLRNVFFVLFFQRAVNKSEQQTCYSMQSAIKLGIVTEAPKPSAIYFRLSSVALRIPVSIDA